ncbi:MAG: aminotransferase class IV [Prolixibacteraceae bacterium]|nr:aminotransferase class IV [Prolixibacteraceae bacterium]
MYQLFETIKCVDGQLLNMEFHQERFDKSRKMYLACNDLILLREKISVPDECKSGVFRCRVTYSKKIEKVEFIRHEYRKIESLKLVSDNSVEYQFKYADRQHLTQLFEKRGDCEDILIIKNNCITDSYTANPIFFDGKKWWTPDTVLLPGTQRAKLLHEGKISVRKITPASLNSYMKVGLVNAFQSIENMPVIDIKNIRI